jgi:integrase
MEDYMARFTVTVRANKSASRPHLKWVVDCKHPTRGRVRIFRTSREQADSEASALQIEVENFGIQALELSAAQRIEALDAIERLKPLGATITTAVREYIDRRGSSTKTVSQVTLEYIRTRQAKGRSKRHLDGIGNVLGRFEKIHGPVRLGDVTADHVQEWLYAQKVGPVTTNHMRAILHSVFEYAFKKKIIRENPIKMIERETERAAKVGILTPDQFRALLVAAQGEPDVLATFAIGGFAGIRPEEIARMEWSNIDLEHGQIDISAEKSKTAKHRYVKIEPVLAAWLRLTDTLSAKVVEGLIQGQPNFRRRYDAVRKAAGFSVRKSDGVLWPHDCLRHSFASFHLAKFKNAAETALQLGHEGTSMLFQNYRSRVRESDAEAWFQLMPKGQAIAEKGSA